MKTRITELFNIEYPVIQGGMIWCSGWKLASAVSNAGGLGLIGAGSMRPDVLLEHIVKCKNSTNKPFGVNIPIMYPYSEEQIKIVVEESVKIVFTSAGSPKKFTSYLQEKGITVVHVTANLKFAQKCEEAGVDAIVAEGFEAGGHNGIEETTTMVLIQNLIRSGITKPLISAGGIGTGRAMLAAIVLGADGVQIGSRFAASKESSAHDNFKKIILEAKDGDTKLTLKQIGAVRLIKNDFFKKVEDAQNRGATPEQLSELLGKGRSRIGMFEGDLTEGELEIGQVSCFIDEIKPAGEILNEIIKEYKQALENLSKLI